MASHSQPAKGWYAVDRDGHVAHFDPGASGAVPREAPPLERLIAASSAPTFTLYEMEGRMLPGLEASADMLHTPLESTRVGPVVVFTPTLEPLRAEIAASRAVEVRTGFATGALFARLPRGVAQQLHAKGACLGCFFEPDGVAEPTQMGIFSYVHLTDSWVAGPYGRRARPAVPLVVRSLPAGIRRFDTFCFGDAPHVQPLDHARCNTAVPAYMLLDGKTVRAIPGRENEYRQFFFPRHRRDPRFLIERVPD